MDGAGAGNRPNAALTATWSAASATGDQRVSCKASGTKEFQEAKEHASSYPMPRDDPSMASSNLRYRISKLRSDGVIRRGCQQTGH